MSTTPHWGSMPTVSSQRGMALVIALVLLIVATLLSMAGIRSSIFQERMTANMFDRSLAMQASEAALRAAEAFITANPNAGVDCSPPSGNVCDPVPAGTFTASPGWTTVPTEFITNPALSASPPQFLIQFLGEGTFDEELGLGSSPNLAQYGAGGGLVVARFFRVIARSHDPNAAGVQDRAVVVLSTTVRRAI